MPGNARDRLFERQRALLGSLLGGHAPPPGFDSRTLRVAAQELCAKRARVERAQATSHERAFVARPSSVGSAVRRMLERWLMRR